MGGALHDRGSAAGEIGSRRRQMAAWLGIRGGQPCECRHCGTHLVHDHSDDDEGRSRINSQCGQETYRIAGDSLRELDRQTVFNGLLRLGVFSTRVLGLDCSERGGSILRNHYLAAAPAPPWCSSGAIDDGDPASHLSKSP